ncbi:hypothetical protein OQA88_11469 [Cercophora sp. LCS_1]
MPSFAPFATGLLAVLAGSEVVSAHMEMSYPPPFRSKFNPNAANIDYSMTSPLSNDGTNYPCKGYQADLGTPAGASTATFAPGGSYNFTITGGAAHGGGSCQASLSYDGGKTFTVIKSIIGGCPLSSNYDFTIPADAQTGQAIFSWSWQNNLGNREFYQNCAPVTIGGGSAKRAVVPRAEAFSSRPSIFLANLGNGCTTVESADVAYPNPGPDVQDNGGKQAPPSGSCGSAAPGGGSGGGAQSPAPSSPVQAPTQAPQVPTQAPAPPSPTTKVITRPTTRPGGVFITVNESVAAPSGTAPAQQPASSVKPTTLVTAIKTTTASVPAATSAPAPSTPASGTTTPGTACSDEGAWNCVDGASFQRCASGVWSAAIPMATGTKCSPGTSSSLNMGAGRRVIRVMKRA